MDSDLLTAREAAEILKVKKSTVYEMIKRGEIPSHKIGKQIRIAARDIERFFIPSPAAESVPEKPSVPAAAPGSLILCGQDVSLDIIANHFSALPGMPNILRSHAGSYNSLYLLYQGKVQIATCHLWDGASGEYNLPYIQRLLPGIPAIVIRLFGRTTGFYVKSGNPKKIAGWDDLRRRDLSVANREKGSGARVLLDERLRVLHLSRSALTGYENEHTSHLSVAGAVARGEADLGLGAERIASQVHGIAFVPLQKEWYDMVFLAEQADELPYRKILDFVSSEKFMLEIAQLYQYDFSQTGRIYRVNQ